MLRRPGFRRFIFIVLLLVIGFKVAQKYINVNPNANKDSKSYVNTLYVSDERIYNNYLNDDEKEMYDFFMDNIKEGTSVINGGLDTFKCSTYNDCFDRFHKAYYSIIVDHPELLSFASYGATYKDNNMRLHLDYSIKLPLADQVAEMVINLKLNKIKEETKDLTDKEKIKYVYNYIGQNTKYDRIFTFENKNQTIYNVFLRGNAVCAGFAKASQVIFQAIGINSYAVQGKTSDEHMWNIVEVDGKYYYFDSTVASCISESDPAYYDGLKQDKFTNYTIRYKEWYPEVENSNLFTEDEI